MEAGRGAPLSMAYNKKMKIVIASKNRGKIREIAYILRQTEVEIVPYDKVVANWDPPEEGEISYEQNAVLKAVNLARTAHIYAIADDSGLEVDALNGKPGIKSSRFGEGISDAEKCDLLLKLLGDTSAREARFVCVATLASPDGKTWIEKGILEGTIARESFGADGFGYDPIFIPKDFRETVAMLPPEIKNNISHRAKAFVALKKHIEELLKS